MDPTLVGIFIAIAFLVISVFMINLLVDNLLIAFLVFYIAISKNFSGIDLGTRILLIFCVYHFGTLLFRYYYYKTAASGKAQAQFKLGKMYFEGKIRKYIRQNDEKALHWYREAAKQGHVQAQFYLGEMYANGKGVAHNEDEATEWYRKAAEQKYAKAVKQLHNVAKQGNAQAQNYLGDMYVIGKGMVSQNEEEAIKLYCRAAEQGYTKSLKNLHKIAEQGHAQVQFNLGEMYANGKGVFLNDNKAFEWYRKAAEQGHAKAFEKLHDAAEDGEIEAQKTLAAMHANEKGIKKDLEKADYWFRIATENTRRCEERAEERQHREKRRAKERRREKERRAEEKRSERSENRNVCE